MQKKKHQDMETADAKNLYNWTKKQKQLHNTKTLSNLASNGGML